MSDAATLTSFLFTDIEGSSLKWLNHRAAMQGALADHDRILRAAIAAEAGEVFKTAGDAFLAAFKRPSDAVNAAIAAQRALTAYDWSSVAGLKVRMAVHCGTAEKREGDYFGPALNRCARLLTLAHGGQVLATSASAELLAAEREVKEPLRLIGTHPLDDPQQPVSIHQVLIAGLPQDFPALRTPETRPTNLPRHLTSLIGREKEMQEVRDLLANHRLVTLTGPGGVGKTRLAVEVGLELLPRFAHGVCIVELAPLSDAGLLVSAVGTALRLDLSGNRSPRDILISHLQSQDILIVLDNCEHVIDAVAELIEAILGSAPRVRILASSQELIGLPGEQVLRVPSLEVPDAASPAAEAARSSAVQLFVERVKATDPKFNVDEKAASAIAAICRRLDGIPLAIEMAAARAPVLGLVSLLQGLDARFRILTGGKRTALPRQRTLHAALDWSHALLSDNDRVVFRRLGVFAGGFTLKAATAVAGGTELQDFEVIDCLADLVARSLVAADTTPSGTRYRLLETMRAYALEKLGEVAETDTTAARHTLYFRGQMEKSLDDLVRLPLGSWHNIYMCDLDNVRTALEWSFGPSGEVESGIALAANTHCLFDALNLFVEAQKWLAHAKSRLSPSTPSALKARLHAAMAIALSHGGYNFSDEAVEALQQAAASCCEPQEKVWLAFVLARLGYVRGNRREAPQLELVLTEISKMKDIANATGWYNLLLGKLRFIQGDPSRGRKSYQASAKMASDLGMFQLSDFAEMSLGVDLVLAGDNAQAAKLLRTVRERIQQSPFVDMRRLLGASGFMSLALAEIGEHKEAREMMRQAVSIAQIIGTVSVFSDLFVAVVTLAGKYEDAARLAGWADASFKKSRNFGISSGVPRPLRARIGLILQEKFPAAEFERLLAEGAQLTEAEACELAATE